jgi:hypothetical protein
MSDEIPKSDAELVAELDDAGVWPVDEPPNGFADAVLARTRAPAAPAPEPTHAPGRRLPMLGTLAAATAIAAAVVLVQREQVTPTKGSIQTHDRETVRVSDRAVVVAEADADLAWTIDDSGRTRVRQVRGEAFYRVDHGDAFEVVTPAGTVQVTGTCFTVEVETMGTKTKAGLAGAGLLAGVAAVMVTVHEGDVVLANDRGRVAIEAGERAHARAGDSPAMGDVDTPAFAVATGRDADARLAELTQKSRAQAHEIERLRSELADGGTAASAAEPVKTFGPGGPPKPEGFDWFEPTQEALEEMARCGVVAWDQPPLWGDQPGFDADWIDAVDMSAEEQDALQSSYDEFRKSTSDEMRRLYVEMGGDATAVKSFNDTELLELLYSRMDPDQLKASREAIAREKAGLAEPPSGEAESGAAKFMRWEAALGEQFETALGSRIGEDRAHELRAAGGGWSSKRLTYTDRCMDE